MRILQAEDIQGTLDVKLRFMFENGAEVSVIKGIGNYGDVETWLMRQANGFIEPTFTDDDEEIEYNEPKGWYNDDDLIAYLYEVSQRKG